MSACIHTLQELSMMQAHTPVAALKSAQPKSPTTPAKTAPIPLDPSLLRQISGGTPNARW